MPLESCIPILPSGDLGRSLRFWLDGLGLSVGRAMRHDGRLVGSMVRGEGLSFWLNPRTGPPITSEGDEGIRLYWTPGDIRVLREHLSRLGYPASGIVDRDYGPADYLSRTTTPIPGALGWLAERRGALPDKKGDQDAAR
jgi:hypothetical protein